MDDLLTPAQVAEKLKVTTGFLAQRRYMGEASGPPFIKIGAKVRYRHADVERWLADQTRTQTGVA